MSQRLKDLLDKRAKAWAEAQDIRERVEKEENRDLTNEEDTTLNRALDDVERFDGQIRDEERAVRMDAASVAATDAPDGVRTEGAEDDDYAKVFGAYAREGMGSLNAEQRNMLRAGEVPELRALAGGTGSTGGYLIPTETLKKLTEVLKAFGGLLGESNLLTTASGNTLQWPTNDDTGNSGALLADNTQITEQDAAFGQKDLGAFTITSKLMRVPWALLQDEVFDLESYLARKAGERVGRGLAPYLATGTGTAEPQGLFYAATNGKTAAGAAAITTDELIDLEHSVDPAYRLSQRCKWVFNDTTLKYLRKLKDADSNYLWQPSVQAGVASTLFGYEYVIDQAAPAMTTGLKSVGFGDIESAFVVRQVSGASLVVMRERYADYLQNGYFVYQRFDSTLDDASAFKVLTQA